MGLFQWRDTQLQPPHWTVCVCVCVLILSRLESGLISMEGHPASASPLDCGCVCVCVLILSRLESWLLSMEGHPASASLLDCVCGLPSQQSRCESPLLGLDLGLRR